MSSNDSDYWKEKFLKADRELSKLKKAIQTLFSVVKEESDD